MDQEVTRDTEFAKLREAEELLDMQIDDFKGEQIDPDNEPDLYLPLSAAKALHKALANQAQALATAEADIAALREENARLAQQALHCCVGYAIKEVDITEAMNVLRDLARAALTGARDHD